MSFKSHHRQSSSISPDGPFDSHFSVFTEEDFKKIDDAVAAVLDKERCFEDLDVDDALSESSFPSEIDGLNLNLLTKDDWIKLDNLPDIEDVADNNEGLETSFASEVDGLNLGTLITEEFAKLDAFISETYHSDPGPSIPISVEHSLSGGSAPRTMLARNLQSPLRQFRRQRILSVTDLSHPTWCEVQFDYGLRGRRSRPVEKRPSTFKSASGKTISVEQKVAKRNDIRTKQGLAIHKELEREIRAKQLEVNITTKETQWALRIVNIMACLKELLHGPRNMTREMPVFGILHDEVVVGIIDEVVCEPSVDCKARKRKAKDGTCKDRPKKRPSLSKSPDADSDGPMEAGSCEELMSFYTLHLRDAKTRNRPSIPDNKDALAGRLQLHIYSTLLEGLLGHESPFNFDLLWKKLLVNPDAQLPTKFLLQAQLMYVEDCGLISLNDLVTSFYELIRKESMAVSPHLELVYYLRPSEKWKGKSVKRDVTLKESPKAAGVSSECLPARNGLNGIETSQFGLAHSENHRDGGITSAIEELPLAQNDSSNEEEGIRRFPLIGKKVFLYHKEEMNKQVSHLLQWWRGERLPEGVPVHLTSRCRTCEYMNHCEWRDAKALELKNRTSTHRP